MPSYVAYSGDIRVSPIGGLQKTAVEAVRERAKRLVSSGFTVASGRESDRLPNIVLEKEGASSVHLCVIEFED